MQQYGRWTNSSVLALAAGSDPIESVIKRAKAEVNRAMQRGWKGPPFDPFELAEHMGIALSPRSDIPDALILPAGFERFRIEYNPERPRGRAQFRRYKGAVQPLDTHHYSLKSIRLCQRFG